MDGYITIGTEIDAKSFDAQIDYIESQLEEIEYKIKQADMGFEVGDTQKLEAQYEKLINQLGKLRQKQADLNRTDFSEVQKNIDKVGNSVSSVIKKVGRWALAIFGIRGAYMAVRNAINVISRDDEQLASDIEYMKTALAYTIEPLIQGIVNLMKQLMYYVAYIVKTWTGRNIFESANKSLNSANKNAQKLSKTLAGFDEMNVLSDTSASSAETAMAGMDLSEMQGEVPSWLQWIANNKDAVIAGLIGIAGGLIAVQLGAKGLMGLGIGIALAGVIMLIQDIIKFINDPSWEVFLNILGNIAIIIGGIMLVMGNWWGLLVIIIGGLVKLIADNWDKIKEWTLELVEKIKKGFGDAIQWVKDKFNAMVSFFSSLISKIVGLFKTIGTKVGDAIGGAFKTVINGVLKAIENILNSPIKAVNSLIGVINKIPGINLGSLPTFSLPRLAVGGIVNMPGRGVPVGGAIAGEARAEGVIPLTDSQAMETLGATIGKYITINANITNTMNGRIISRELQKINTNSDFAFNR